MIAKDCQIALTVLINYDIISFVQKFEWSKHKMSILSEVKSRKIVASGQETYSCHNPTYNFIEQKKETALVICTHKYIGIGITNQTNLIGCKSGMQQVNRELISIPPFLFLQCYRKFWNIDYLKKGTYSTNIIVLDHYYNKSSL